jgi:hypothetical protein
LTVGVLALATPARADAVPSVAVAETACGVDLTFDNPTAWAFSFDYRVDAEQPTAPVEAELADLLIKEGPRVGQPFEPRYQVVTVEPGESTTEQVRFTEAGDHQVTYWLNRGPEQRLFLADATTEVDVPESCVPTPEPTATPTVEPTTDPTAGPTAEPTTGAPGGGGSGNDELPVTGAAVGGLTVGAVLLIAGGIGLVLAARRRRTRYLA